MIRLGGPGPPQVDPNEEAKKANEAVMGNVVIFALLVGLIKVSPRILESLGSPPTRLGSES
jgi:hypothetical protein